MTSVIVSLVFITEIDECANAQCNGSPITEIDECANVWCNGSPCFDLNATRVCQ